MTILNEDLVVCENIGCDVRFAKKTHNQKYHDNECTKQATSVKLMDKYYKLKAIRQGLARYCEECKVKLSRYNNEDICSACSYKKESERNQTLMNALSGVIWQQ